MAEIIVIDTKKGLSYAFPPNIIYLRAAPSIRRTLSPTPSCQWKGYTRGGITLCKSTSIHSKHKAYLHIRRINDPSGSDRSWGKLALLRIQLRQLRDSLDLGRCCVPFPEHPLQTHTSPSSRPPAWRDDFGHPGPEYYGRHVASRARASGDREL